MVFLTYEILILIFFAITHVDPTRLYPCIKVWSFTDVLALMMSKLTLNLPLNHLHKLQYNQLENISFSLAFSKLKPINRIMTVV